MSPSRLMRFLLLLLVLGAVASVPAGFTARSAIAATAASEDALNLRAEPDITADILLVIPAGAAVEVTGERVGDYLPVTYDGVAGWASAEDLEVAGSAPATSDGTSPSGPAAAGGWLVTIDDGVNLRSGPSTDSEIIDVLSRGTRLQATGDPVDGFYPVDLDGQAGWVSADWVAAAGEEPATTPSETGEAYPLEALNLRVAPDPSADVLAVIPAGDRLDLNGETSGEWVSVMWAGLTGWVSAQYLGYGEVPADFTAASTEQPGALTVLMYHDMGASPGDYRVTPDAFAAQMAWLSENGYQTITPSQLQAAIDTGAPLPARPVIVTIDDGWPSMLDYQAILADYGFIGSYFIPNTAWIGPDAIQQLASHGEICGHTVSHQQLNWLDADTQWHEIADNKAWLESIIGYPIGCFAYPFGVYDGNTTDLVASAGYGIAFDATRGVQPLDGSLDRYHINRVWITGWMSTDDFVAAVAG